MLWGPEKKLENNQKPYFVLQNMGIQTWLSCFTLSLAMEASSWRVVRRRSRSWAAGSGLAAACGWKIDSFFDKHQVTCQIQSVFIAHMTTAKTGLWLISHFVPGIQRIRALLSEQGHYADRLSFWQSQGGQARQELFEFHFCVLCYNKIRDAV